MILKMTSGIDKYLFPDGDVLSEVGIERRKHLERGIYRFPRQLAEQLTKFFLRVVGIVHFAGYPACLIAQASISW